MKTNTRRRARLRSSQYTSERWKPSPLLIVLVAGLLCGLVLGVRTGTSGNGDSVQEHYLLLVSDLYAQGAPLTTVRDRLKSVGYANPAASVLAVADSLAASHDPVQQQEADQLRQFSDALAVGDARARSTTVATVSATTQAATPTDLPASPTTAPLALVTTGPAATDTPAPAVTPTPDNAPPTAAPANNPAPAANPVPTRPPPTATSKPASTTGLPTGKVVSSDHKPVTVRQSATTKSVAVAVAPDGATVYVKGIVKGEAVLPGGTNWYHVIYNGHEGYIYGTLVKVGG
ncbi:MAG TPA: hypothetical protein VFZ25_04905 [Chloroflexota bacterium]|nr:hypothetical protein [Chloroflexota bacterium]